MRRLALIRTEDARRTGFATLSVALADYRPWYAWCGARSRRVKHWKRLASHIPHARQLDRELRSPIRIGELQKSPVALGKLASDRQAVAIAARRGSAPEQPCSDVLRQA